MKTVIDVTKKALEDYPDYHVMRDPTNNRIIALFPLYDDMTAQYFSYADRVQKELARND